MEKDDTTKAVYELISLADMVGVREELRVALRQGATQEQIDKLEDAIMYVCHCYGQAGPGAEEDLDHQVNAFLQILGLERSSERKGKEDDQI